MRVLTRISHDDHDLGEVYELEGELLDRLLANGIVLPADRWSHRYVLDNGQGDQQHIFTAVAPAPAVPAGEPVVGSVPPAPVAPLAPDVEVR